MKWVNYHYLLCFSRFLSMQFSSLCQRSKFQQKWLFHKDFTFCLESGIWTLCYVDGYWLFFFVRQIYDGNNSSSGMKISNKSSNVHYYSKIIRGHVIKWNDVKDSRNSKAAYKGKIKWNFYFIRKIKCKGKHFSSVNVVVSCKLLYCLCKKENPVGTTVSVVNLIGTPGLTELN